MPTADRCVWDVLTSQVHHGLRARGVRGAVCVVKAMLPTGGAGEGSEGWPMTADGKDIFRCGLLLSLIVTLICSASNLEGGDVDDWCPFLVVSGSSMPQEVSWG